MNMMLLYTEHDYMNYFPPQKSQDLSWEKFTVQLIEGEGTDVGCRKRSAARLFVRSTFWGEMKTEDNKDLGAFWDHKVA